MVKILICLQFKPYSADIIPIVQDSCGVVVEEIEKVLAERKRKMLPIPKVNYYYICILLYYYMCIHRYSYCNNYNIKILRWFIL